MVVDPNAVTTFEWCYQHLGLIGWPTLFLLAWRTSGWFASVKSSASKAVEQVDKMATDYFPAMRDSLKTQDHALTSVDSSLKTLVQNQVQFATAQPARRKRKKYATTQPARRKSKK